MENVQNLIKSIKTNPQFSGKIAENEPLSPKSTFKVGGNALLFIAPEDINSFKIALSEILQNKIQYFIIGGGSNIVFPDQTFNGVILSTENLNKIQISTNKDEVLVTCNSGTTVAAFVNFCTKNNLSGAEQFAGLPGTVGGAVFMNARCFEKSISDILFSTEYLDFSKPEEIMLNTSLFDSKQWDYKKSPFQDGTKLVTTATFKLTQQSQKEHDFIEAECKKYINERVSKGHFKFPSAGSVFKNNHTFGKPSGKIIDEAGLKGFKIGGAQIAPFHGNFIINVDHAKASDIKALVEYTQKIVFEKFGFKLETEIIFVDNQL